MLRNLSRRAWLAAVVVGLCLQPAMLLAQGRQGRPDLQKSSPKVLQAFREVVKKAGECTVRVQCDGKDAALGTVIAADGWVLTKYSELKGKIVCKLKDGRELDARVFGVHEKFDLALLLVEVKGLPFVELSDSKVAPVGNWLASAGLGDDPIAVGVVSVAARDLPARQTRPTPAPSSAYLGVAFDTGEGGAKVTQVLSGTGAEKAGLKVDDTVVALAGEAVQDLDSVLEILRKHKPGETIDLKVKRGDKEIELKVTLGKRPADRSDVQNSMGSELSSRRAGFPTILQHDQVIKPSDCGGPVVDLDGRVIGINIARAGRTESYAIPGETVRKLLPELLSGKLAPPDPALVERVKEARTALEKAVADKTAAEKKAVEAKAALEKAEAERIAAEKKATEAKAALLKAEAEAKKDKKSDPNEK
jgi:serine protease Do